MERKKSKKGAAGKGSKKAGSKRPTGKGRRGRARAAAGGALELGDSIRRAAPLLNSTLTAGLDIEKMMELKRTWSRQLLRPRQLEAPRGLRAAASPDPEQNVVGVGLGERIAGGRHTGVTALKFFVRVKYGDDLLGPGDRLPESVDGLPTDIEEVGTFRRFQTSNPRALLRPAPPGCSVGFEDTDAMAGTFGALVKRGARRFILSNNHVLAAENRLPVGAPTFQPGFLDAGVPPSNGRVGALSAFVRLHADQSNLVDCAISEVSDPTLVTNSILKIGVPKGAATAQNNMVVHKFGRTTGYRVGLVDTTVMDVLVDYDMGTLAFEDQIIVRGLNGVAFSDEGDSGALVVERNTGRAVGLIFAGSASHTIANHIGLVFQALNVSLA